MHVVEVIPSSPTPNHMTIVIISPSSLEEEHKKIRDYISKSLKEFDLLESVETKWGSKPITINISIELDKRIARSGARRVDATVAEIVPSRGEELIYTSIRIAVAPIEWLRQLLRGVGIAVRG